MEPNEYERMYTVENQHWWYLGMAEITCSILNYYTNPELNQNILDAGCGTGAAMSTFLSNYGNVTGFDISPLAIRLCQKRHLVRLTLASVLEIPFPYNYFDLITSFDVLYERAVIKDSLAVDEFMLVLRPGGFLFLRLPAYDWLRGHHDITIHTARRYTKQQVTQLLINSGFQMVHITYANSILFPPAVAKRMLDSVFPPAPDSSDLSIDMGILNGFFRQVLSSEAYLATRIGLPFGLSVLALGRKPLDNK